MLSAFYDENDAMFLMPETADIEYIEIRREDVAAGVEVSEEELQEYYLDSQNRYLQDEQRQARHILILFEDDEEAAEAKAADVLAEVSRQAMQTNRDYDRWSPQRPFPIKLLDGFGGHGSRRIFGDGFYHVTHLLIAAMIRKRSGRIINIVSTSGQTGMPGQVNYSAAKAGQDRRYISKTARRQGLWWAETPSI